MNWYDLSSFQLRSKNAAGTVLHTYAPMLYSSGQVVTWADPGIEVSKDSGTAVVESRITLTYANRSIVRGIYPTINVRISVIGGAWTGASTFSNLETVMGERFGTNYLELSLNGGSSWTRVEVDEGGSDSETKLEGKNIGLHRETTFVGTDLVTSEVAASSGGL